MDMTKERIEKRLDMIYALATQQSKSNEAQKKDMAFYLGTVETLKMVGIDVKRNVLGKHTIKDKRGMK